jgi:hypothetical protein
LEAAGANDQSARLHFGLRDNRPSR